jgi:toxin HigB-1
VGRDDSGQPCRPEGLPDRADRTSKALVQLNNAVVLGDLAVPPGNKLEALKGNLFGRYSVLINDQWRIVFRWTDAGPEDVEITTEGHLR